MIIDSHLHIGRLPNSKFADISLEKCLRLLLEEMSRNKINRSFVLANCQESYDSPGLQTILKLISGVKNISVIGSIDILNYKKTDLQNLEKLLSEKKILGLKLYTGYQYFYPNDPRCTPVYNLCLKFNVPVIFHSGDTLSSFEEKAKVKYSHPLHIDEVATDFPKLKIIIAHLGNPWVLDCAEVLYKNDNVYADISGLVVNEGLNTPYGRLMKKRIQELIIYSSPRKLLYGTDWPLVSMKSYLNFVKTLGLSKSDLDYILYKNAATLFNL